MPQLGASEIPRSVQYEIDDAALCQESAEEGFAPSSLLLREIAKTVLRELQKAVELSPSVYPTADQEIALQFVAGKASVLILCDSSGGGACFSFIDGKNRQARFDDALDLPSGFATAELLRLAAVHK